MLLAILFAMHTSPPPSIQEPMVPHEEACDRAFDKQTVSAADFCLLAADEWASAAAAHNLSPNASFYEIMEALTRLETSGAMRHIHNNAGAIGQMELAVSICSTQNADKLEDFEIAVCNSIGRAAVKTYPEYFSVRIDK